VHVNQTKALQKKDFDDMSSKSGRQQKSFSLEGVAEMVSFMSRLSSQVVVLM
jgi:hypothetical protein